MYKARINSGNPLEIEIGKDSNSAANDATKGGAGKKARINSKDITFEIFREHKNILQLIRGNKTFDVLLLKVNHKEKTFTVKVNGNKYEVALRDKYDELLTRLGFDLASEKKVNNVKAPMPGLVLSVLVDVGNQVRKGDALVVLEAMKMENILKSPADGMIKKVSVKKGTAVEKNQVLIEF
jgi:biotin carboxyl carrier protein